jgi:hypothetical protein
MLTTDQKGAIAETAIAHEATKLGIEVYRPIAEGGRFDMIFLLGGELARVQCKWAARRGDVVIVRCYSCRRAREGLRKRPYSSAEIDAFAAYCAPSSTGASISRSRRLDAGTSCSYDSLRRETTRSSS